MSARTAMRTMRSFSQSVRLSKRCVNTLRAFDATPQMKLKPSLRMNQMEYLNKKMCSAFAFSKMNKAELQRMRAAVMTVMASSSSAVILNLAEILSATLSSSEDEESTSSGVRRRRSRT